jgi:predicted nucleotidyltransferase
MPEGARINVISRPFALPNPTVCCSIMHDSLSKFRAVLAAELPRLRTEFHVNSLGLFGSFVKGTQHPDSDLDILVTFDQTPSLLKLIDLENQLGDLLGVKVDLVMRDSLKSWIRPDVLSDLIAV